MIKIHPRFQLGYFTASIILVISAIFIGFNAWISISIGLVSWLVACITYPGFEFSEDGRQMRNYHGLFCFKLGRWEKVPPVTGITVKFFSEIIRNDSKYNAGIWNSSSSRHAELIVMLSVQNSSQGIIIEYFPPNEPEKALEFAKQLAERFKVPVNSYLPRN